MRQVSYGRIRLGLVHADQLTNETQETGLICLKGAGVVTVGDTHFTVVATMHCMCLRAANYGGDGRGAGLVECSAPWRASTLCSLSLVRVCAKMRSCTSWRNGQRPPGDQHCWAVIYKRDVWWQAYAFTAG